LPIVTPHHILLRYRNHGDLMDKAVPMIREASAQGDPVVIIVPDTESRIWVQHLDTLDVLEDSGSIRLLVYPVNLRGWAWGVRAAFTAGQRALEERLEGHGRPVLVLVRLPDVLLLVGELQGVQEVEDVLDNLSLLGTVVCAYHETLAMPAALKRRHEPAPKTATAKAAPALAPA
jgi:hypothetical protein